MNKVAEILISIIITIFILLSVYGLVSFVLGFFYINFIVIRLGILLFFFIGIVVYSYLKFWRLLAE